MLHEYTVHSLLLMSGIPYSGCIQLVSPSTSYRIFRFFPAWIYYEECCYSHSFTDFSVNMNFHFSGIKAQECNCLDIWLNVSLFYKKLPNCFQKRLYHFIFLLSMYEGNSFSEFHVTCVLILTIVIGVL